jgi:hypothetical protein
MSRYRIACAFVPDFALAVGLRGLPGDERDEPVVLVEPDERARVRALNAAAEAGGARLGQTAARARAVVPGLHCPALGSQSHARGESAVGRGIVWGVADGGALG